MKPLLPDIDHLSLVQQVAQMVVVRASGYLFDDQIRYPVWEPEAAVLQTWLQDWGVGGVILLGGSAAELSLRSQQLQNWSAIPLLLAADIEEGVGQRFSGATWFPPPMALAAIARQDQSRAEQLAFQMGQVTAQEAQAIGLNWVLAPVVDVNNNSANPVINVRAFGETPEIVSSLASAFIRGAHQHAVLTTAKHFPGHGDTAVDSHLDLPVLNHEWERLQQIELPPFRAAIAAGVDGIMSAHLQIPALDPDYPATLSDKILTEQLRGSLGFAGLIVTDALIMGAIANRYGNNEAAVLAVAAGADILLMPPDPVAAIQAVCEAVETGRIPAERIRASVERIWQAKQKVCAVSSLPDSCHAWETPVSGLEANALTTRLSMPTAAAMVTEMLQASLQVHQPVLSRLTSTPVGSPCRNLVVVDDTLNSDFLGHHTPAIAMPAAKGYELQLVDRWTTYQIPAFESQAAADFPWRPTLLQLFIRGNPFRGSAGLSQTAQDWLRFLLQTEQLQALVIYGSPYILAKFLPDLPTEVPYVFTYGQMPAAQVIALRQLFQDTE